MTNMFRLLVSFVAAAFILSGCFASNEPLVVYAGKGLKEAVEEIISGYEHRTGEKVSVIYAGSNTLLTTIENSQRGDIFIPGSERYVKKAGSLITSSQFVALHVPIFAVRSEGGVALNTYADLLQENVRIAVGNGQMAAIGKVAQAALSKASESESFKKNIVITSSTVNELVQLVASGEVDAALIWKDMLDWSSAKGLKEVSIPDHLASPKKISVNVLSVSKESQRAREFADFVATEGKIIFEKHGFGR